MGKKKNIPTQMEDLEEREILEDVIVLEKYVRDLFNFLPLPTLLSSPLSVILEFNPSFEDISGFRLDEVVGKHI
ncbi:hypothetical protein J7K24_00955, partial [bacterium]|nr:hypothetical protein [bacterium]